MPDPATAVDQVADALVDELNRYEEAGGRAPLDDVIRGTPYAALLDEPSSDLGLRRPGGRWAVVLDDGDEVVVVVGPPGRAWRRGRVREVASEPVRSRLEGREHGSAAPDAPATPIWPPPPGDPRAPAPSVEVLPPPTLVGPRVWWLIGANFLAQLVAVAFASVAHLSDSEPATLLAGELGFAGVLALTCYIVARRDGTSGWLQALGVRFRWSDIPLALVVCFGINVVVNALATPFLPDDPDDLRTNTEAILDSQHTLLGSIVIVLVVVLIAPFVEELFFRGLLLRTLSARMPWWRANIVQASLFTVQHLGVHATRTENVITLVNIGVVGLVFGYIATRTGRLGPTMVAHFVMNASALAFTALR